MPIREFQYATPRRVLSGPGAVDRLSEQLDVLGCERVALLGTRSLIPHLAGIEARIGSRLVTTFPHFRQHTPRSDVDAAAQTAAGCDGLVAFGGGSVIDGAKAVAEQLGRPPQISIPTTLSAGEFTPFAGVTDDATRKKGGAYHPELQPRVVIHDATLARHTPASLWLSTGMRAMDHALEAIWSTRPQPMSTACALEAIRLLRANLAPSRDPAALDARTACFDAAWLSISGMLSSGVRLSHPIGHQIGAFWNVPHGVTSCIALPTVMRHLLPRTREAQSRIAEALGVARAEEAADAIEQMVADLGLPGRLRDAGARREDLPAVEKAIAEELTAMGQLEDIASLPMLLERMW